MIRFTAQIGLRFATYAVSRTIAEDVMLDQVGMSEDNATLAATGVGLATSFALGRYTDGLVNVVADRMPRRRNDVAE